MLDCCVRMPTVSLGLDHTSQTTCLSLVVVFSTVLQHQLVLSVMTTSINVCRPSCKVLLFCLILMKLEFDRF
jgi:hypothetical protein